MYSRDYIMEMIERFMAVLFRIAGLKAVAAYDDMLVLINDYLRDLLAQAGRTYEPESLREYLATTETTEDMRVRVCALLKEKAVALLATGEREQAAETLGIVLMALHSREGGIDREGRRKILQEVSREIPTAALDTSLFSSFVSVLVEYGLYAKADDAIFSYPPLRTDATAQEAALHAYETMLAHNDAELHSGNFSRQEVEESVEEIRNQR